MIYKQVSLIPWLELADIQIGNAIFWKYNTSVVSDGDTKVYLDKYVKCYVDKHQQPIKTISIASYKDKNYFEPLTAEEYQELNFARNLLCVLCIGEQSRIALVNKNSSIGPPSSDIFDMVSQNFIPGTEDIAVKSGSMTSGGWTEWEPVGVAENIDPAWILLVPPPSIRDKSTEEVKGCYRDIDTANAQAAGLAVRFGVLVGEIEVESEEP